MSSNLFIPVFILFASYSSGARAVWHSLFGDGEHGRKSVRVTDVEEHPFGDLACHPLRREVNDEKRLLPLDLLRVGALLLHARENAPPVVAEIHGELQKLVRACDLFDRLNRPDAHVQLFNRVERNRRLHGRWREIRLLLAHGFPPTSKSPARSSSPNIRFMFCTACPAAPFTRLSITESTTSVSEVPLACGGRCSAMRHMFAALTERVSGWLPAGSTSTKGSCA